MPQDRRAALICTHVARDGLPVLRARIDEPVEAADSGWQFLCGVGEREREGTAQVWAVEQVLERDPSLRPLMDAPPGSIFVRESTSSAWRRVG